MEQNNSTTNNYERSNCQFSPTTKLIDSLLQQNADLLTIQFLLEDGADVNTIDHQGYTPLLLACYTPYYEEIAELLICRGANVNPRVTGWSPLHCAAHYGWVKTTRLLITSGANINAKASCGLVPLLVAVNAREKDVVELFINLGADVNHCDAFKDTPLHYASKEGWLEVVQSLLKRKACVNARNILGETPLHLACMNNQLEIAETLLNAGADCQMEDGSGTTPFRVFIRMWPNVESFSRLINCGAYFETRDYKRILKIPLLKKGILKNVKICSRAIVNKFNNKDLPSVYSDPMYVQKLPCIEHLKIGEYSDILQIIESTVELEIKRKGHCKVLHKRHMVLRMLCIKSLNGFQRKK